MFAFIDRLLARLTAPYADALARLDDQGFRALLARI